MPRRPQSPRPLVPVRRTLALLVLAAGTAAAATPAPGVVVATTAVAQAQAATPTFASVRGMVDELEKSGGLGAVRAERVRNSILAAEKSSGAGRTRALRAIAESLKGDEARSVDVPKVRALRAALVALADAQ